MDGSAATGLAEGEALMAFAGAALRGDPGTLEAARAAVAHLAGVDGMVDAAAVIGGFDGITRIADATRISLEQAKAESADFIKPLGTARYRAEKV